MIEGIWLYFKDVIISDPFKLITVPLLIAIISGLLVGFLINMHFNHVTTERVYQNYVKAILLETGQSLGYIRDIKDEIRETNQTSFRLLSNKAINSALSNPVFVSKSRLYELTLLSLISQDVDNCNNVLRFLQRSLPSGTIREKNNEILIENLSKLNNVVLDYQKIDKIRGLSSEFNLTQEEKDKLRQRGIDIKIQKN